MPTGEVTTKRAHNFGQQVVWQKGSFWERRGYRLHVKTLGETTQVWVQPLVPRAAVA